MVDSVIWLPMHHALNEENATRVFVYIIKQESLRLSYSSDKVK